MARLTIFNDQPAMSTKDDFVGTIRTGAQLNGRPTSLDHFRFTFADPEVGEALTAEFGGEVSTWDTKTEQVYELYSTESSIDIILDGPEAVRPGMVLWGRNAKIRSCTGEVQDNGQPCVCPSDLKDRKAAASAGTGCQVDIYIQARLASNPGLGKFRYSTGSWSMAKEIGVAQDALDKIGGPARAKFSIERVSFTTKDGTERKFNKPVLKILGPA